MTKKSEFPVTAVRWHSIFVVLIALALMFFSCGGDNNGDGDSSSSVTFSSSSDTFVCPISEVQGCVGTGSDTARLFIQWNDGIDPDPMVWIYRFNSGDPTQNKGIDMIFAVAKSDSKFGALVYNNDTLGYAVGGLGYFFSGDRVILDTISGLPGIPIHFNSNGLFEADSERTFDNYINENTIEDHWRAGWCFGFWSYNIDTLSAGYTSNTLNINDFTWTTDGVSQRVLHNNSADYYTFFAPLPGCPSTPSSSSNGGDPSSSSNGEDLSSSSSEETSASAKINPNLIHPANRNIRIK